MTQRSHPTSLTIGRISQQFLLLFLLAVPEISSSEYPPYIFNQEPSSGQATKIGETKIMLCSTDADPSPMYRWLKDGEILVNYTTYTYHMLPIQSEADIGQYRCEASNNLGAILSSAADVQVAYFGQFDQADSTIPMSASVGEAIVMPYTYIKSNPEPSSITWYNQDGRPVGDSRHQKSLNGSLVLLDIESTDTASTFQVEALHGVTALLRKGPLYTVTVTGSDSNNRPPTIVIPPEDQTAVADESLQANFECIFNARPVVDVSITWYKITNESKTQIMDGDKYLLSAITSRMLTIRNPRPEDNARYQCEAVLPPLFTDPVSASAELIVYVKPMMNIQFPAEVNRDFGQMVTLHCTAKGFPSPTKHWYFNAQELKDVTASNYTVHSNGSLTIVHLDMEHAGMYQCFLRNVAGEASKSTWLKVNSSPPMMLIPPDNVTIIEGGDVRFMCKTRGAPKPTVAWSRVTASGSIEVVTDIILETGDLLIASAAPSDSGLYTCNASNSQGFVTASATLSVLVRTQIVKPPQIQRIIKGSSAVFYCGVTNDPSIVVTWEWRHRSVQMPASVLVVPDGRKVISDEGTLSIYGVNNEDIGDYTCNVISDGGNDTRTVSLTVIELPQQPVISSVELHGTDVRAVVVNWNPGYDGNTPILSFSVQYKEVQYGNDGGDGIELMWITSNVDIGAGERQAVVTGLRPAKYYQFRVIASNEVGEGQPSVAQPTPPIEMPQQPPSSPPKGFFGMPASNISVILGWQPPNEDTWNGPLQGYNIHYKLAGYPNNTFQQVQVTVIELPGNPRFELGRLAYFQEYEIQIAAYNAEGIGVYSGLIHVMTLEGHPTAPPESLQATATNSTTIQATWTPPNQQFINGRNLGYKVLGKRKDVIQTEFVVVVPQDTTNPTGTQTTLLHGLLKYTEYTITVVCYTSQGEGPEAVPVTTRTEQDVPSQVASLTFTDIQATSLKVNWSPPTSLNGILTGYTLMYEIKDQSENRITKNLPASNLTYTISDLRSITKYTIYVYASTSKGPGPPRSADIESGVPPELPTAPFNLGVSNIQARSVLLQFLPGFDGKTSITLWLVEALEGLTATTYKPIFQISDPDARSLQVQNLKPYTYYRLRITAENVKGRSNASDPTRLFQTQQDAPGAPPGNVTVRALNATRLRVSWTPLQKSDWNGEPRGYKIYYRRKDSGLNWSVMVLDNGMNMNSAILTHLEEWLEYEVKMLAYNDVGDSIFSTVTVERTRESVPSIGPSNVSAEAISPTSVNISWGEVEALQQNGMILGFKVEYRSFEMGISQESLDVPGNSTTSVIVPNLLKYVTYNMRVLAYTRMGDGVASKPEVSVRTLADVPGPPRIIWFPQVSFENATIEWEPPEEPNGIILNYMVSYKLRDSPNDYENITVVATTRKHTVYKLQRQAYYEFRVTAETESGWGETSTVEVFTMNNRSPPFSPTNLEILHSLLQARAVTISWIPNPFNGYGPLRNFTVQYKTDSGPWTSVLETILPSTTTYTVEGLKPNTHYVFQVASTNDEGESPYSDPSETIKTLEDRPDGAPRFVKVDRLNTSAVKVTWEQPLPDTWNGELEGYVLMYRQVENSNYMEEKMKGKSVLSTTLVKLVKFVNYEFLLKAYNSIGQGPTSTPITVFVGEAAPTAPPENIRTTAINSTEIRVVWEPPPLDTHNGELSAYQIAYWLATVEQPENAKMIVVPSSEFSWVLQNLTIYADYAITVQALNLAGEGPQSDVLHQRTLQGLPGKPATLSFWNVTFTSLEVEWSPPSKPNGEIVNYELSYLEENAQGGSKEVKFNNVSGNVTLLAISELIDKAKYIFTISARTLIGSGDRLDKPIVIEPQPGSPGAPSQLTFHLDNNGQLVTLQWQQGVQGQYPIYGHLIQANSSDSTEWQTVAQVGAETRATVNLLQFGENREYQLRVVALNRKGMGPASAASQSFSRRPTPAPPLSVGQARAFHYQWWFLVIVALTGLIIILVIISLLCLISRRGTKHKGKTGTVLSSTSNLAPSAEPEEGGFSNLEMTRQSTHSRRQKYAGIRPNGATNNIYARSPPRPSPASVAYSDDDAASATKPPLPDDDEDDDSSCTEKPSELGDSDSQASYEASDDDDSIDLPLPPPPPASPPPPPFSDVTRPPFTQHSRPNPPGPRHAHGATAAPTNDTSQNQWGPNQNSSFNAYQYTDSEAESSHYAFSLNGGQIMLNNTAGSRAPLPGFSSFV